MKQLIDTGSYMTVEEFRKAYGTEPPSASIEPTMEVAGVPARYRGVEPDTKRAAALGEGKGLYLFGDVGTGKTTMACAVMAGWLKLGHRGALYVSSVDLAADLMPTSKTRETRLSQAKEARLLVLDDLGKEPPTPWILAELFAIVDARWAQGTAHTIVTSQLAPSELGARLAERGDDATAKAIVSRLSGMCSLVKCAGQDGRLYGRRG